jgi:DNA-binding MarR family transcriptional regulator
MVKRKKETQTKLDAKAETLSIAKAAQAQSALEELDRVFHEKARLGIMTAMAGSADGLNFNDLKTVCHLTDGNLNRHLKVLVDAKVLSVRKSGQGRSTNSHYRITASGRKTFQNYLTALEKVVSAAQEAQHIIGGILPTQ